MHEDSGYQPGTLYYAVAHGDLQGAERLLRKGASVEKGSDFGLTPLMEATRAPVNQTELVALLLEHKADVNARTSDGMTALIMATSRSSLETIKLLIDSGADPCAVMSDNPFPGLALVQIAEAFKKPPEEMDFLRNATAQCK